MSNSDFFQFQPITAILPEGGDLALLEKYSSALYARLEKVQAFLSDSEKNNAARESLQAESEMLKQVIDWLSLRTKFKGQG